MFAPAKFLGDLSGFFGETISFDARMLGGDWLANPAWGDVLIRSGGDTVEVSLGGDTPPNNWTTFSASLTGISLGVSEAELLQILGNVTQIRLTSEDNAGIGEIVGYDNFVITPEPGSALLVGLGLGALALRRRRRT